jgi:NADPH:quinone reductase-like Zn-dependent oxidoreductase
MQAIVQDRYGPAGLVLTLQDVAVPVPNDDQVLVRVHAASVHPGDWLMMRGRPYVFRPMYGFRRPRGRIPGLDLAGRVEAAGKDVAQFRPGDEVFGTGKGTCADYTIASTLAPKPASLTFEEAAAVPTSGVTALRAIRTKPD